MTTSDSMYNFSMDDLAKTADLFQTNKLLWKLKLTCHLVI